MNKLKIFGISVIIVLLFSLSASLVAALYTTRTTEVTIGSNGTFAASEPDIGVSYSIKGIPGATGNVITDVYNGNPQPTATIPNGTSLASFIVIKFNINASDFAQATITIAYTDSEVQGLAQSYSIYKYNVDDNIYELFPSTLDTTAKTLTVTLNSINDPLLAIGGPTKTSAPNSQIPLTLWVSIAVVAIVAVLLTVFLVRRLRSQY